MCTYVSTVNAPVFTPYCPSAFVTLTSQEPTSAYGEISKVQVILFGLITVTLVAMIWSGAFTSEPLVLD